MLLVIAVVIMVVMAVLALLIIIIVVILDVVVLVVITACAMPHHVQRKTSNQAVAMNTKSECKTIRMLSETAKNITHACKPKIQTTPKTLCVTQKSTLPQPEQNLWQNFACRM